jgi:hypothetical protein
VRSCGGWSSQIWVASRLSSAGSRSVVGPDYWSGGITDAWSPRQLDERQVVIRASFEVRDLLLQSLPETFSVPKRFAKHMMIVADMQNGNADAIEDPVVGAWELQSGR